MGRRRDPGTQDPRASRDRIRLEGSADPAGGSADLRRRGRAAGDTADRSIPRADDTEDR